MRYLGFDLLAVIFIICASFLACQQPFTNFHLFMTVVMVGGCMGMLTVKEWLKNKDKQS